MIRRLGHTLRSLWSSIAFNLTLTYGLLAVVTTLVLLAFIHLQTVGVLHGQIYRQTTARALYLVNQFEQGGRDAVVSAIDGALSDRMDVDHQIFLYLDETGNKLAGNLDETSDVPGPDLSVAEIRGSRDGIEIYGRMQSIVLPDDSVLIVGRDLKDMYAIKALIGRASLAAVLVALILVACGTYVFRKELELRVGTIRRTAAQISAGQFKQRIPASSSDDEFAHLNRDINDMLDRVESLMQGVRHVTDTVAHNLRTPLTRVLGRLHTVQRPGTSPEQVLEATQFAIREIQNLTVLFDKLLQIAEIEAGVQRQNFELVSLHKLTSDVVELYEPFAEENGIRLTLVSTQPYRVMGDADLLASAVANVVENGLKYARSRVELRVDQTSRQTVRICVVDDGPGIPDAERDNVGTHFYRLDPDMAGYGLGLTSVRAITRLHNGRVQLGDARPGLEVTIELPVSGHHTTA